MFLPFIDWISIMAKLTAVCILSSFLLFSCSIATQKSTEVKAKVAPGLIFLLMLFMGMRLEWR
ncbi:MAG: hypothetical protein ACJAVV_003534 [Alphaproteobacteria bacterium]|jgi:hypothetical protein